MLKNIINVSIKNKLIVLLFTATLIGYGIYALTKIPIGVVPDITNNQVQVITTSRNLSTQDVEKYITYPIELEMANLPGVTEIRSVSKFGLSVVTIVFEEDMGTYLPRQLISEKLITTKDKIPAEFGSPEMGPITTGLGEIYQYTLEVDSANTSKYSIMDLRSIQDWIIKRQLSGIKGVVEINTWGGYLKQYEVAINPNQIRAMNISLSEIFTALENNNGVSGGGYIEKNSESYFIRGEGQLTSIEDIENIVVENRNGTPIKIKNIATIKYGHAIRFGAITGNGEGEKVMGQVMMLKDANSNKTIERVKNRVAEIQKSLPEGVYINGFLERSELIGKTTFTISENLILGCLIVIFVVILLIGNWRSGLVIASVIPLALLFAISMMYIFGVDANLMSLGAIDFGIIIDGAVIIVEFIAFKITSNSDELLGLEKSKRNHLLNEITLSATNKMMHSAVFGQVIIMIVFIPILSLAGVEGKMFKPMALTFCFALLGAILLCFTYVPVVSSLILKPSKENKNNISYRILSALEKIYTPTINWALGNTKIVIGMASLLLISSIMLFNTMGGEFVPTLDEGDFVIQPVIKTGTSLSKTIEITTEIERVLTRFPEVKDVVTRIGAAEIPTDPMSMEESDVIIKLNPKSEWVNAISKDELANKFKKALENVEGVEEYEFTQPIEMRFNELITGVRADIAIKVFGENLDSLNIKANQIKDAIQNVDGASDIIVEKTAGLPQMSVKYNRNQIAKYGLNIAEINKYLSMAFAGTTTGIIYEGEKRFDLVVRLDNEFRKDLDNIKQVFVPLNNGSQVPLSELAEISYSTGPAKISRDDTKRRVVVGVNVRDRDLESVVTDIQNIINSKIKIPPGYEVTYGGQFENLESAKQRLLIAVPISLLLIFILLYFAFQSVKDALLIYSAIPLSAVGGIVLLWIRDLPFSISAGVGFIALFGIAVLNGIVLIEHYKELQKSNYKDLKTLIIEGTKQRLRPVLLTASAAALGFLPMAISTNAGAEVQRPLATVVVGGLITATLLTLIVLPVLYYKFNNSKFMINKNLVMFLILVSIPFIHFAQTQQLSLDDAISIALENNNAIKASNLEIDYYEKLKKTSFTLDKTNFTWQHGQYNSYISNDNAFTISQRFELPSAYTSKNELYNSQVESSEIQLETTQKELIRNVKASFHHLNYLNDKKQLLEKLDSLYLNFQKAINLRYDVGEGNLLEKLSAETQLMEIKNRLKLLENEVKIVLTQLKSLLQIEDNFDVKNNSLSHPEIELNSISINNNPNLKRLKQEIEVQENISKVEKNKVLPDLTLEYFNQSMIGFQTVNGAEQYFNGNNRFSGFQVGLGIPIFTKSNHKSSQIQIEISKAMLDQYSAETESVLEQEIQNYLKLKINNDYYKNQALPQSKLLIENGEKLHNNGEIGYLQYIQTLNQAINIKENHLQNLLELNLSFNNLEYIIGK